MRKRRRRLKPGVILWGLLAIDIAAGLALSPVTSAARIRVIGSKPSDRKRIDRELTWLQDKPCLAVVGTSVEEQIMRRPDVRSAVLKRNIFGSGELTVAYYTPVALVAGPRNVVLTEAGSLCPESDPQAGLPTLYVAPEMERPTLGMSPNWEPLAVAEVCRRAIDQNLVKNLSIAVTISGTVCLNSGVTGRVLLGTPDDLEAKFEKMRAILVAHPDLLAMHRELVLVSPSKPVTRPMEGNTQ